MPKVKNVEKQIWDLEGFDVHFLHLDGRDVRGDMQVGVGYSTFERAAPGNMTVARWKEIRFGRCFPGFKVRVLDADGRAVSGRPNLATVRRTYAE